jgi:hypothetical protein
MNTKSIGHIAIAAGIALGLGASSNIARAEEGSASQESSTRISPAQERLADATLKLENAFNGQFVAGKIDRDAMAGLIDDVVQATPEHARPKMAAHIDQVLAVGANLAARMTPEQRTAVAAPPAAESVGKTQQAQLVGFGWPGAIGFGGFGAFGFPAFGAFGLGFGSVGFASSMGFGGFACGAGCGLGFGW